MKRGSMTILLLTLMACGSGAKGRDEEPQATLPRGSTVTVYPILLAGEPSNEVAGVVALLLEKGGMEGGDIATAEFKPDAEADFDAQVEAFVAHAKSQVWTTDYALFSAYEGTPGRRVDAVCSVLVDRNGAVVWKDCQQRGSAAFDRMKPNSPMTCTMLLVNRLKGPLQLQDPFRKNAPRGPIAERLNREAGIPSESERVAMAKRAKEVSVGATVTVYDSPELIVLLKNWRASAASAPLPYTFQRGMNQQKMLWSAARSIQAHVRRIRPETDYVLVVQAIGSVQGVHTFLLDRSGELVVVDFQNSHHEDFRKVAPKSSADVARLAAIRLERALR